MRRALLEGSNLYEANLTMADLRGADFCRANIIFAKIKDTIITQYQWDELTRLYSPEFMAGFVVKELEA